MSRLRDLVESGHTLDKTTILAMLDMVDRLETAEAQVARVREVCESDAHEWSNEYGSNDWVTVENILEALDGDGR